MVEVLKQDKEYNEKEEGVEVLEDKTKPKIPKKVLFIGGGVLTIGLLAASLVGNFDGDKESTAVDTEISADAGTDVFTDIDGNPIAGTGTLVYSDAELQTLSNYGYTGEQIENFQAEGSSFDDLVAQAEAGREEVIQETYKELRANAMKVGSKEYKDLLNLTWLSGKAVTVSAPDPTVFDIETITDIVDYVRLPARGQQLFVRLTVDGGGYVFYNIKPDRYVTLKDKGNMVVTYDKIKFGGKSYIDNVQEIQP